MAKRIEALSLHLTNAGAAGTEKFTKESLKPFNGTDSPKIYIALKGDVFDVTSGKAFYGPGSSYNVIAGRDGSVSLGMMELEPSVFEKTKVESLTPEQKKTLDSWHSKFASKYKVVGKLI